MHEEQSLHGAPSEQKKVGIGTEVRHLLSFGLALTRATTDVSEVRHLLSFGPALTHQY